VRRREFVAGLGAAAAFHPLNAMAQPQRPMRVIGVLTVAELGGRDAAFRKGLSDAGYVEGRDLAIEYRVAAGHYDRLPAMAAELVASNVALIATGGPPAARAAKAATASIPIVFLVGSDPVKEGLVASLARPGGNLTGVTILARDLASKRLELIGELVPRVGKVGVLVNLSNPAEENVVGDLQAAARAKRLDLAIVKAGAEGEIDAAFAALTRSQASALVVGNDSFLTRRHEQIVALAARAGMPAIYAFREYADAGGLISYGIDIAAAYRQVGLYAGKILKGATPANLPVQQPDKFELVINLKTAKALGLTVPPLLLTRADEVIE
jgi:putative ABC transport system substrate-binding protein